MAIAGKKISVFEGRIRSVITINVSAGHGGSITPSARVAIGYGLSKMFVIKPWRGYSISDIEVDGISIDPVNMYMFTNLTEDHMISATFKRNA